jgi:myosin heavy subunit
VPYARLSGTDGMRLSRAAFAVMIKFSEFFSDFKIMIDEIEMMTEVFKDEEDSDLKLKEHIKSLPHYE